MNRVGLIVLLMLAASIGSAQSSIPAIRFRALDVYVDSANRPLGAWQMELKDRSGKMKIVGIEGGESKAYAEPPFYDPAAMMNERVILAAFSTSSDVPKGKTRVARIHVQITGEGEPDIVISSQTAGDSAGNRITATVTTKWSDSK